MKIQEDLLIFAVKKGEELGADFVEARYEDLTSRTLIREKDTMKDVTSNRRRGVAIRTYYKGVSGFSYSASIEKDDIGDTVKRAIKIAKASESRARLRLPFESKNLPDIKTPLELSVKKHPSNYSASEKKDLVDRACDHALSMGEVNSVIGRYGELLGLKEFVNSENRMVTFKPLVTDLRIGVILKDETGNLIRAGDGTGGALGLEYWDNNENSPEVLAENAYNWAKEKCEGKKPPAGEFRVLTDPTLTAVLAHESFGHLAEADGVVDKTSPLTGKIGEKIAFENVNVMDVGIQKTGLPGGVWLPFDDQGVPTADTVLVKDGVLKSYLHDRGTENALSGSGGLSGNARALSFTFAPIPRMKNTIFQKGEIKTEEEMLELLGTGIYSISTTGGSVSLGDFQFFATRGYWVENGEKKYPLKDHLLTGNILSCLQNVEALGQELRMLSGFFGGCGKGGQNGLSVGMGAPHMLFSKLRVGGETN